MKFIKSAFVLGAIIFGAQMNSQAQTVNLKEKVWIENSEGKSISFNKDTIDKSFFEGEWVELKTFTLLKKGERILCIFLPPKEGAKVYYFNETKLPESLIQRIQSQPSFTSVTFVLNGTLNYSCTFVLK